MELNWDELRERGWAQISGIRDQSEFIRLAERLGKVTLSVDGSLIKSLKPTDVAIARPGTLSSQFGLGAFPFHTDTAFWVVPARFVLLMASGDTRRSTLVCSFRQIQSKLDEIASNHLERSIWLVRTGKRAFYSPLRFNSAGESGWRYDAQCMSPANAAAVIAREAIKNALSDEQCDEISWHPGDVAVLSNWNVLHARGPAPMSEGRRCLDRIYVR